MEQILISSVINLYNYRSSFQKELIRTLINTGFNENGKLFTYIAAIKSIDIKLNLSSRCKKKKKTRYYIFAIFLPGNPAFVCIPLLYCNSR